MTDNAVQKVPVPGGMARLATSCISALGRGTSGIAPIAARIALAVPFFKSGLTRWDDWFQLSDATKFLFEEQFKLHIFGSEYDMPVPDLTAFMVGMAEIALPILLVLGLATRLSALGLLVMTAVIQLVVPDGWANFHLPWAALALSIIAMGPGALSIDHLLKKLFIRKV